MASNNSPADPRHPDAVQIVCCLTDLPKLRGFLFEQAWSQIDVIFEIPEDLSSENEFKLLRFTSIALKGTARTDEDVIDKQQLWLRTKYGVDRLSGLGWVVYAGSADGLLCVLFTKDSTRSRRKVLVLQLNSIERQCRWIDDMVGGVELLPNS